MAEIGSERISYNTKRIERRGNTVHLYNPEGMYSILYGLHNIEQDSKQLPEHLDGIVIETGEADWYSLQLHLLNVFKSASQYKSIMKELGRRKIPIYYAEPYLVDSRKVGIAEGAIEALEATLGIYLMDKSMKRLRKNELSRRDFLNAGGKAILGSWLSMPFLSSVGSVFSPVTGIAHNTTAEFSKLSNKLHPEIAILIEQFRDTVIAHKEHRWGYGVKTVFSFRPFHLP